ncbi:MAG: transposase [Desulfosporosinus sp.]|nr:transposase [Desulfosporosinus sp.]
MRKILKTYRYRIYLNKEQTVNIDNTLDLCRNLYNSALEHRIYLYKHWKVSISYNAQQNELPMIKQELPEYTAVHSQVLQDVLRRLDKAYQNFFRRVKQGETPGIPRFQGYKRYNSFTYSQSGFSLSGSHLQLSKLGNIKVKLHRQVIGEMKTCTVVRKNGRYYVCFSCEVENQTVPLTYRDAGIDMGIKEFCITSDGELIPNPKNYRQVEDKLKNQQRAVSRKKKGSHRRKKAVRELAGTHEHILNQRKDNAYKVAKNLLEKYDTIVREDLQIANMIKNHKLAKSISDAGWGLFFNILDAKAKQTLGKRVIAVDPKYTSQVCSGCGQFVKKELSVRVHHCSGCGLTIDRDINAAINILRKGLVAA